MSEVLEANNYNMLFISASAMETNEHNRMWSSIVDGYIVYGHKPQQYRKAPWSRAGNNVVAVDSSIQGIASVNIPNEKSAYCIAKHALSHRPERVAVIGLALSDCEKVGRIREDELFDTASSISNQRLAGYRRALAESGLDMPAEHVWHIPYNNHKLAYQAAMEVLTMAERPQLLLCMSDRIAFAALQVAAQMGIHVPQELQVVGFDGTFENDAFHPSITTMQQPTVRKGQVAAEILLGLRETKSVELETELVVRESCPCFN